MNYKQNKVVVLDIDSHYGSGKREFGVLTVGELITDSDIPEVKARTYSPNSGDKLYLYPGCDIPRFKMKSFCEQHKVALVKTKPRAKVCFVGEKTVKDMYTERYLYQYGVDYLNDWMDANDSVRDWSSVRQAIKGHKYVYGTTSISTYIVDTVSMWIKPYKGKEEGTYVTALIDPPKAMEIFSNPDLYFQDEILRRINSGTVLDEEMYENLRNMLGSSDNENARLAMETMANCDYEKCSVYLLLLMREFGEKIQGQSSRHHVNFKSLLKFFNVRFLTSLTVDCIVDALLKKKLLNQSNLDMLMKMAHEKVSMSGNSTHFKVESLQLSTEIIKGLEENILDVKIEPKKDPEDDDEDEEEEEWDDVAGKREEEADLSSAKHPELFVSYSGLNKLLHSPQLFYRHYILGEREEKLDPHLIDGKVIHCLLLDNGSFDKLFSIVPVSLPTGNTRLVIDKVFEKYQMLDELPIEGLKLENMKDEVLDILKDIDLHQSLKTDAQRLEKIITEPSSTYFEFLKIKGDKDLIDQDTLTRCKRAVEILSANEQVSKLLGLNQFESDNIQVYNELKIQMKHSSLSFGIRGIVDNIKVDGNNQTIYINDLKTTSKTLAEFQETLEYFKYNLQASMYDVLVREKFNHVLTEDWKIVFNFVVIDRYDQVYCFEVTPESMETWRVDLFDKLKEVEWHLRNESFSLPYKFATSAVLL